MLSFYTFKTNNDLKIYRLPKKIINLLITLNDPQFFIANKEKEPFQIDEL